MFTNLKVTSHNSQGEKRWEEMIQAGQAEWNPGMNRVWINRQPYDLQIMLFSTQKTPKEPTEKLRLRRSVAWYKVNIQKLKALLLRNKQNLHENKKQTLGLPWWCSGWESACQCSRHGFEPWSGKIPHAAEQLGPWATTTETARLEPVPCNKRGRDSERPAHRDEEWPPLATTRESPRTETKT